MSSYLTLWFLCKIIPKDVSGKCEWETESHYLHDMLETQII